MNEPVKPTGQLAGISKSVEDIIDFLDQLKTYTESAVTEHDQAIKVLTSATNDAINKITGAVVDEAKSLNRRVRVLTRIVVALLVVTVGMAVYLCSHR